MLFSHLTIKIQYLTKLSECFSSIFSTSTSITILVFCIFCYIIFCHILVLKARNIAAHSPQYPASCHFCARPQWPELIYAGSPSVSCGQRWPFEGQDLWCNGSDVFHCEQVSSQEDDGHHTAVHGGSSHGPESPGTI